jgi:hypothetical protein
MFKMIKTVFGINTALAQLGINTQDLNPSWRQGCQQIALQQGLGSKAVAAYMFYQLPLAMRTAQGEKLIKSWLHHGGITMEEYEFIQSAAFSRPGAK